MLSERETALCSAVLAMIGTDAIASMMQWPVPGHQRLDTLSDPAGCLAATSQPDPLVTLISIGVTPQSSPDTFLTQSVCLSDSAAAPRRERRIPSAVARHIHRQGSTHDGDTLASERKKLCPYFMRSAYSFKLNCSSSDLEVLSSNSSAIWALMVESS